MGIPIVFYINSRIVKNALDSPGKMGAIVSEQTSPLASLVLCLVILSVFGTLIGSLHWYTVDLPEKTAISSPENGPCRDMCEVSYYECVGRCDREYGYHSAQSCYSGCEGYLNYCYKKCK